VKIKKPFETMKLMLYFLIKEYFNKSNKQWLGATLLLTLINISPVTANASKQNTDEIRISIKLAKTELSSAIRTLEERCRCSINYNPAIFKTGQQISIEVKDMPLSMVLKRFLEGTGVAYKINDPKTVLLYKIPEPVKPGKISGRVMDEKGEALPGAGIKIIDLDRSVSSGVDGSFSINADPGTYTVEVSYISYQTKRITGVIVKSGQNITLNISMKPASATLNGVVVTADYKKTSVEGLLTRQKNASEMTNGISAEQIGRTPDKHIGESLNRISGVSTMDNKFVVVRGITARYNAAVLDGTALPSTEAQNRSFSFDMIPSNLVDNVVVSKTITPDMNTSFGGGLIQINTKDMPTENFMSFTIGTSYNDQTTGKPFYSHERGKYDFLGFDDGRRSAPDNLLITNRAVRGPGTIGGFETLTEMEYKERVSEQSKRFKHDNFTLYQAPAMPNQNYQFTMGRLMSLNADKQYKIGFTGALSYRNTQSNLAFDDYHRGKWAYEYNNNGNSYSFNTTWGALLNMGLQLGQHRFSLRNTYTRVFDNDLVRTAGFSTDQTDEITSRPPTIRENDDPTFTSLMQNKLMGQHQLGKVKLEWDAARTAIKREEKAITTAEQLPQFIDGNFLYLYYPGVYSEPKAAPLSSQYSNNNESHYTWNVSGTLPFNIAGLRNTLKAGFYGNRKKGGFDWKIVPFTSSSAQMDPKLAFISIADMQKPENMRVDGYGFQMWFNDKYSGKSRNDAGYLMLDNRLGETLRLVWGVCGDYYKYTAGDNPLLPGTPSVFELKHEPAFRWLPSANLTYSVTPKINIRASWSIAVVRPELMDNTQFYRYSPYLDGMIHNVGITSTKITSYDVRAEWFPSLGETFSVSGFYKNFDKPVELSQAASANLYYVISNSEWAKVYGLEFEMRKNLDFIADKKWLSDLTLFGNATLQRSQVEAKFDPLVAKEDKIISKLKRPMSGQTPYLVNLGLQYQATRFGFNAVYNKTGRKTYIVAAEAGLIDYEMPRSQTDVQLSYKWIKNKILVKLNGGNLFNEASSFYKNNPDPIEFKKEGYKAGTSEKYEPGEQKTFTRRFGRTFSLQLNYNF
jgi:TonB-dependent receptor